MNTGKYISEFRSEMEFKNYAPNTVKLYVDVIYCFLKDFDGIFTHPKEISEKNIKEWLKQSPSLSTLKIRIGALKNFYIRTIRQPLKFRYIEYPRSEKRLPRFIDQEDIKARILAIENIKHKAILAVAYCCCLRVSEVINLKISDIDGKQRVILIRQSKGKKDRYVGISGNTLEILREYFTEYRPKEYLFEGQTGGRYSTGSCEKIYHKYIDPSTGFHSLRHAGLTSMVEAGTNILAVQAVAGHNNPKTTAIYYHTSKKFLSQIPAPI